MTKPDKTEENFRNEILLALPPEELEQLRPLLTPVRWISGQPLLEAHERIEHVWFVESGFASVVASASDTHSRVEVGLIGREGMVGLTAMLDAETTSFNRVMVQMPGGATRMTAAALRDNLGAMPVLRRLLTRSLLGFLAQISQTAACNSQHTLQQRLARWMLMAHDRADGDTLEITQTFLALMLAVRRSGVTIATGALQQAGHIRAMRGQIVVRDRQGLESAACECHNRVQAFVAFQADRMALPPSA